MARSSTKGNDRPVLNHLRYGPHSVHVPFAKSKIPWPSLVLSTRFYEATSPSGPPSAPGTDVKQSHKNPASSKRRCAWAASDPVLVDYHDAEWGIPEHDDHKLFEFLVLEGAQAGLSWLTVLKKRGSYRRAFNGFDPEKVARYGPAKVKQLLADAGIIRNRLKIAAAVQNAQAVLAVQREFGSFDAYVWQFVGGQPIMNRWRSLKQIPAKTAESDAMNHALRGRNFRFVGSTICYAYMQAVGMVNDHLTSCFRRDVERKSRDR